LKELQEWQRSQGRQAITELPAFAAETVDAVVALTKAIKSSPQRRDGESIVRNLRQLDFDGVSGRVQFTTIGDRKDPQVRRC
jgi:ABC-type branched-subunit amino acid transport system substrate-binding protein